MYGDGGGLWLTVRSPTSRSWLFIYVINRITRRMGLGPYPEVTLAMAREQAAEARRLVKAHRDPLAERQAVWAAEHAKAVKAMTFKQCAEQYIRARRKTEHTAQWVTTLSAYAFPVIGNIRVASIDTGLVLKVLGPMWASKNETALRLRRRIENVLEWAKLRGYRNGENPARWLGHLDHILPAPTKRQKVGHHTAPPFNFLAAVAEYESKSFRCGSRRHWPPPRLAASSLAGTAAWFCLMRLGMQAARPSRRAPTLERLFLPQRIANMSEVALTVYLDAGDAATQYSASIPTATGTPAVRQRGSRVLARLT